jgi:uncharacterized protein YeeX (DUF496 family)
MDTAQNLFNVIFMIASALAGWWLKNMWDALRDLQDADKDLADKVSRVEVLVAGNYVTRDELARSMQNVVTHLERIEDKLDRKVDRS